jgi:hypothetical protein
MIIGFWNIDRPIEIGPILMRIYFIPQGIIWLYFFAHHSHSTAGNDRKKSERMMLRTISGTLFEDGTDFISRSQVTARSKA